MVFAAGFGIEALLRSCGSAKADGADGVGRVFDVGEDEDMEEGVEEAEGPPANLSVVLAAVLVEERGIEVKVDRLGEGDACFSRFFLFFSASKRTLIILYI